MLTRSALSVALVLALVPLAGCAKGPKDKLQGKWIGDRIENVPAEQVAKATGWVKGATMEFSGDKLTMTIPTEPQPRTGEFKVAKVEGPKLTVDVKRSGTQEVDQAKLTFAEDMKSLRWDIGDNREIVLVRTQ